MDGHVRARSLVSLQLGCVEAAAMRRHRPKPVHDPELFSRTYSCTARRWHAGSLTLLIAVALVVVSAAEVADATRTYARRRSRRQGVDGAGFISPASTADSWASFPRPNDEIRPLGGLGGTAARGGGSYHRHNCATRAASSALLCCRWQTGSRQRSGSSSVARLPRLRNSDYSGRGRGSLSSSHLLLLASAVGVDVNATVAADIAPPVASAEVALPLDAGTKKKEHAPQQQQQKRQSSLIKESTSIEGKEATVIITEARGRPHTVASRAKISAANKGKKPWNVGVGHSEETRRKIAEGSKNAARRRKLKTAESLVRNRHCCRITAGGFPTSTTGILFLLCLAVHVNRCCFIPFFVLFLLCVDNMTAFDRSSSHLCFSF